MTLDIDETGVATKFRRPSYEVDRYCAGKRGGRPDVDAAHSSRTALAGASMHVLAREPDEEADMSPIA